MEDGKFDTTVRNLFETEEYKEYCQMRYEWAQKGYIAPDAATTTEMPDTVVAQKIIWEYATGRIRTVRLYMERQ